MMRFEYDQKFIKLLAKEMVKEMQKVKSEVKEPELITVKEAAETLNLSEDYVRKIKDKLAHVKQGNSKQGPNPLRERGSYGCLSQCCRKNQVMRTR